MNILLDTHIISAESPLPEGMRQELREPRNEVYLSVLSVWEVIVKHQIGKLPLPAPPETYLPAQRERHRIASLPVDEASVAKLAQLPPIHRDPFDRMLLCQALQHDLVLATVDHAMLGYTVEVEGTPFRRARWVLGAGKTKTLTAEPGLRGAIRSSHGGMPAQEAAISTRDTRR